MDKDPDIDTLPLLAWSREDVVKAVKEEGKEEKQGGAEVVEWQHWYAGPLLAHLHVIWQVQSLFFVQRLANCHNKKWQKNTFWETTSLLGHWAWRILLVGWLCDWEWARVFVHWYIAELIGGSGIAGVVFCNHYPLEKLEEKSMECWSEMQIDGTVNMDPGVFNVCFFILFYSFFLFSKFYLFLLLFFFPPNLPSSPIGLVLWRSQLSN